MKSAFVEGARGVLSVPYDVDRIKEGEPIEVIIQSSNPDALFEVWVKELIERAALRECAIVDVEVHTIQPINKTDTVLTATAWTASLQDAKPHATGIRIRDVRKGSALCKETKGVWNCEVTLTTTA